MSLYVCQDQTLQLSLAITLVASELLFKARTQQRAHCTSNDPHACRVVGKLHRPILSRCIDFLAWWR